MKKEFLLILAGVAATVSYAGNLTPEEAFRRACESNGLSVPNTRSLVSPRLVLDYYANEEDNAPMLYVFNTQPGFMIVSANDAAVPLLGYSTSEDFDPKNINPSLQYMLSEYAAQIAYAAATGETYQEVTTMAETPVVEPLVKTKWGQSAPFWNKCPGGNTQSGCVATSMSQVMNYHQWPDKGVGSISYNNVSCNFGNTTFDWDNMLDVYKEGEYNTTQANAVATLMAAAGASVYMAYGRNESTASFRCESPAFYKYFKYNAGVYYAQRDYYSAEEYGNIIINQLVQGYPVIVGGSKSSGGHSFICDGINENGYFHINWGWSGLDDGYYRLDAFAQGGGEAYNINQELIINIVPEGKTIQNSSLYGIYGSSSLTVAGLTSVDATMDLTLGDRLKFFPTGGVKNTGGVDIKGNAGALIINKKNGNETVVRGDAPTTLSIANLSYSSQTDRFTTYLTVTLPETLEEGEYIVKPLFLPENSEEYVVIRCPYNGIQFLTMNVKGTTATFQLGGDDTISPDEPEDLIGTSFEYNGISYTILSETEVETSKGEMTEYEDYSAVGNANCKGSISLPSEVIYDNITYTVIGIGTGSFGDTSITEVTLPKTLQYIGAFGFGYCLDLTKVNLPESLKEIEPYAFYSTALSSIEIPAGVSEIPEGVFFESDYLSSVKFNDGLTSIGDYAFQNTIFTKVELPSTLTSIGEEAFTSCDSSTFDLIGRDMNVTSSAEVPPVCADNAFYMTNWGILNVPSDCVESYQSANIWKNFNIHTDVNVIINQPASEKVITKVSIDGMEVQNWVSGFEATTGQIITVSLAVPEGYKVLVNVNGVDDSQNVSNNIYTVEVGLEDIIISVALEEDETDGISSIENIVENELIYNLNGVRVTKESMTKGMYIINGKKVLVK